MRTVGENLFMLDGEDPGVLADQDRMDFHLAQRPGVDLLEDAFFCIAERKTVQYAVLIRLELFLQRRIAIELPDKLLNLVRAHGNSYSVQSLPDSSYLRKSPTP